MRLAECHLNPKPTASSSSTRRQGFTELQPHLGLVAFHYTQKFKKYREAELSLLEKPAFQKKVASETSSLNLLLTCHRKDKGKTRAGQQGGREAEGSTQGDLKNKLLIPALPSTWSRVGAGVGGRVEAQHSLPAYHQPEGLVGSFHQGNGLPPGAAQHNLVDVHHLVPGPQSGAHQVRFAPFFDLLRERKEPWVSSSRPRWTSAEPDGPVMTTPHWQPTRGYGGEKVGTASFFPCPQAPSTLLVLRGCSETLAEGVKDLTFHP